MKLIIPLVLIIISGVYCGREQGNDSQGKRTYDYDEVVKDEPIDVSETRSYYPQMRPCINKQYDRLKVPVQCKIISAFKEDGELVDIADCTKETIKRLTSTELVCFYRFHTCHESLNFYPKNKGQTPVRTITKCKTVQ